MHQFDEHHPRFSGYSVFFEEQIAPQLDKLLKTRSRLIVPYRRWSLSIGLTLGAVAVGIIISSGEFLEFILVIIFASIIALGGWGYFFGNTIKKSRDVMISETCSFVGLKFNPKVQSSDLFTIFSEIGLFQYENIGWVSRDQITGTCLLYTSPSPRDA